MTRPRIAIIDPNTLSAIGLKQLLQNVLPIIGIDMYGTLTELMANQPELYFHYFAAMNVVIENKDFFDAHRHKTIVLSAHPEQSLSGYHSICTHVPEPQLVRSLLMLEQHAHPHGRNLPEMPATLQQKVLSDREIEVLSLIVQGYINKEVANRLNIGLTTVITHRRNIMDKLGLKSVSALTIYAIMHGYVDISQI